MRWSDGSYLEDQDHWWLSGIHRDVYLLAKPREHMSDFFVTTPLELDADGGAVAGARCAQSVLGHGVLRLLKNIRGFSHHHDSFEKVRCDV